MSYPYESDRLSLADEDDYLEPPDWFEQEHSDAEEATIFAPDDTFDCEEQAHE